MGYTPEKTTSDGETQRGDPKKRTYRSNQYRKGSTGKQKSKGKSKDKGTAATTPSKQKWSCKTDELKHDTFYYGDGMANKFSTSKITFLEYGTREFSDSESKSIENGKVTITEIQEPPTINSKTELKQLLYVYTKDY